MKSASNVFKSDVNDIISDENIPWHCFAGSTVFISGATGLIGGLLARVISAASEKLNLNIHIIAHGRSRTKGEALSDDCGVQMLCGDIRRPFPATGLPPTIDYIFHCAAITKSADMLLKPADVLSLEAEGTINVLKLVKKRNCRSFVYLSSMEVYGQTGLATVRESDLGYLCLADPRNSYPMGKRYAEMLCNAHAAQYEAPAKIARLARTFGAGMPNDLGDMRVASQFARSALASNNIELHTAGGSIANCCYTADAIRALLMILLKGKDGEAYNIANPEASTSICEMAELVADKVCAGKIKVVYSAPEDIVKCGYAPDVGHKLNVEKLGALGWKPKYGLEDMFRRMLTDWQERQIF